MIPQEFTFLGLAMLSLISFFLIRQFIKNKVNVIKELKPKKIGIFSFVCKILLFLSWAVLFYEGQLYLIRGLRGLIGKFIPALIASAIIVLVTLVSFEEEYYRVSYMPMKNSKLVDRIISTLMLTLTAYFFYLTVYYFVI